MNANALRAILLVKNVEEQDPDGSVLPLAERDAATRDALRRHPAGSAEREAQAWQVLAERADSLRAKLAERHPVVTRAVNLETQIAGVGGLLLFAAFMLGVALSLFDSRVRIEILAFPLLGVVLWNLVVYAVLAVSSLRRRPAVATSPLPGWTLWPARWTWQRAARLIKQASFYHRPLSAALRRFSEEWWPIARPLLALQGKRLFHFGSAAVAGGLIAGFYLRGIAREPAAPPVSSLSCSLSRSNCANGVWARIASGASSTSPKDARLSMVKPCGTSTVCAGTEGTVTFAPAPGRVNSTAPCPPLEESAG